MPLETRKIKINESYRSLDRSKQKIEACSKALDEKMEKGRQIQRDFLPQKLPELPNWDIAAYFTPAKQVFGDFYDVFSFHIQNAQLSDDITMLAVQRLNSDKAGDRI